MSDERDEMAADALADRDITECRECAGSGHLFGPPDLYGLVQVFPCHYCDSTGVWAGR